MLACQALRVRCGCLPNQDEAILAIVLSSIAKCNSLPIRGPNYEVVNPDREWALAGKASSQTASAII